VIYRDSRHVAPSAQSTEKIHNAVALFVPVTSRTYFMELARCFEPLRQCDDILIGRDFDQPFLEKLNMPKAARIAVKVPASSVLSENSGGSQFVTIALFSGTGLLMSLIAIIAGIQGGWY
jgi:hypothetical protein